MTGIPVMFAGQAEGAIPNGSWVIKQNSEEGDGHRDGTEGRVLSSIAVPEDMREEGFTEEFFYFIDWGGGVPVGTIASKVRASV